MVNAIPVCQLQLSSPLRYSHVRDYWGDELFGRPFHLKPTSLIFDFSEDKEKHSLNMLNKAWFVFSRSNSYWLVMSQYSDLEPNQRTRKVNSIWLKKVVQAPLAEVSSCFPWTPGGRSEIGRSLSGRGNYFPVPSGQPAFLINIPIGHMCTPNGLNNDYTKITSILERLKIESFGNNETESRDAARNRLGVVIGINQLESMNPAVNCAFADYISRIPEIEGIRYRIFGFFWNAGWKLDHWICSELKRIPNSHTEIYNPQNCYTLLKKLNDAVLLERLQLGEKAERIREVLEWSSMTGLSKAIRKKIPYNKIRQKILRSMLTQQLASSFEIFKATPVFFVTMDPDFLRLRTAIRGYFDWYLRIANQTLRTEGYVPSVMSLGYQLDEATPPLARLAVKCDMVVRDATNQVISGAVYSPEPGTVYHVSKGLGVVHNIRTLSFIAENVSGQAFESRRLINNGVRDGIMNRKHIIFNSNGALITTMPDRMYSGKIRQYRTLSRAQLKKDGVLNALRGISQVHFHPLSWAHNVYDALPSDVKKGAGVFGKLSGFMSQIYSAFDPISLIEIVQDRFGRSAEEAFDLTMVIYNDYSDELFKHTKTDKRQIKTSRSEIVDQLVDMGLESIKTSKNDLKKYKLTAEWCNKIVRASYEAGNAFFNMINNFNG